MVDLTSDMVAALQGQRRWPYDDPIWGMKQPSTPAATHFSPDASWERPGQVMNAMGALFSGGLHGLAKQQGFITPQWTDTLAGAINNPSANAALGVIGGVGGKPPMSNWKKIIGAEESHPNYVYHATNEERLGDIAESGSLKLHKPSDFTDQSVWPDGSRERRNYFTPTAQNTWQFAPEEGKSVLLRVLKEDHPFKREITGDLYSVKPVPASKLEALGDDGQWRSIRNQD